MSAPPPGRLLTGDDVNDGFASGTLFDHTAWRLETLDWYTAPATEARLARFLDGEPVTAAERMGWLSMLQRDRAAGKAIGRVHVVSEPLSDYLRYELACYESSAEYGEDIRILPAEAASGAGLPAFDFWLFDGDQPGAWVLVQLFGERGAHVSGVVVTDPGFVADCRRWRDTATALSTPLGAYQAERSAAA
jgi:hypothetical protein